MTAKISFPPLRELSPGHHEARKQHLLTEIAREPTWPQRLSVLSARLFPRSRSRRSVLALAVLVVTLMGAVGVGMAAGLGAFSAYHGIGAVQHHQQQQLKGASDVLDPETAAWAKDHLVGIQLDTARNLGPLPNGQEVYVITGTQNDLCALRGPPEIDAECGAPLSRAHPATIYGLLTENDPGTRWITYGIALNGVTAVSFAYSREDSGGMLGPGVTVPVHHNLWVYPSDDTWGPNLLQPVTAHFADGTTVTEPATGANCAAC